jgi:hypothetical protein
MVSENRTMSESRTTLTSNVKDIKVSTSKLSKSVTARQANAYMPILGSKPWRSDNKETKSPTSPGFSITIDSSLDKAQPAIVCVGKLLAL